MIKQVQDIPILSDEWKLTKSQRFQLYSYCAKVLMEENDFSGSFNLYLETSSLVDLKNKN